ncbi:peptidoglycan/LPS O-acetylase OafA/YrhL [Prauserella shujinwangii]|uniref:Peptidoglycan/LPS O-acetylase OafA/YrhL n=2 Tax=Prauserella shujinwangii TaxID=1453103 RepID=A0A2T0LVJ4_9PSEU|nr:peptidoglycan/LPS O-acetylase OafA/YrhL [Prauserella shujinwangii]
MSPGYLALMAFFAMSGYQISDSWERDPSWWRFSARRLLRILPPLLVVVLCTVFVIGPLCTMLTVPGYFSHPQTWDYLVGTSSLFFLQHALPGVFAGNPYPWSVNGSLWTLPMEFVGYVVVLLVGVLVAAGSSRLILFVLLAGLVLLDSHSRATFGYHGDAGSLFEIPVGSLVAFLVPFVLGMVMHTFRRNIPLRPWLACTLLGVWLAAHWTPLDRYLLAVMASYGAIVLAHHWPRRWEVDGRLVYGSYGMYIWAFPVQQLIILAGVDNQWWLMAMAVPAAYLCGVVSWCLVEEPTQRLRRHLKGRSVFDQPTVRFTPVAAPRAERRSFRPTAG